eukprot:Clim_evm27s147 gene=Clim_evmTU27s147
MLRRAAVALGGMFRPKREIVGEDLQGIIYYKYMEGGREKRGYDLPDGSPDFTQPDIPFQWEQWLRRSRQEPPSVQELNQDVARKQKMADNVERLKAEELAALGPGATNVEEQVHAAMPKYQTNKNMELTRQRKKGTDFEPEEWKPS